METCSNFALVWRFKIPNVYSQEKIHFIGKLLLLLYIVFYFRIDQFKVKLRDLGEIRKITLGHENNFARKPWYLERVRHLHEAM